MDLCVGRGWTTATLSPFLSCTLCRDFSTSLKYSEHVICTLDSNVFLTSAQLPSWWMNEHTHTRFEKGFCIEFLGCILSSESVLFSFQQQFLCFSSVCTSPDQGCGLCIARTLTAFLVWWRRFQCRYRWRWLWSVLTSCLSFEWAD